MTRVGLALISALAPADALADAGEGDVEYGAFLAAECTTCHSADGAGRGIPAIVGLYPPDFVTAMEGYRSGVRVHPVMNMVAGRMGDEEIAALAAYFASLDP